MHLLPPSTTTLPTHVPARKPAPTHCVTFYWKAKNIESERHIIGCLTMNPSLPEEVRRIARITAMLDYKIGHGVYHYQLPMEIAREARTLSDLERMRRKWNKVMRAYHADRAAIEQGTEGIFITERLAELDALLEQARTKVERTYGHRLAELDDTTLAKRTAELDAQGLIDHQDFSTLS